MGELRGRDSLSPSPSGISSARRVFESAASSEAGWAHRERITQLLLGLAELAVQLSLQLLQLDDLLRGCLWHAGNARHVERERVGEPQAENVREYG